MYTVDSAEFIGMNLPVAKQYIERKEISQEHVYVCGHLNNIFSQRLWSARYFVSEILKPSLARS